MTRCRIDWIDEADGLPLLDQARVQRAVDAALETDGLSGGSLTVLLVDDAASADLHGQHFDDPTPTDVMTFPDGSTHPDDRLVHHGDLAVGVGVAHRVAATRGRPVGDELILYIVHGVLHLLGHDDHHPDDRAAMWELQQEVLGPLGIDIGGMDD